MPEIRIQKLDFHFGEEYEQFRDRTRGKAGAVAAFIGLVRDQVDPERVTGLELEHYPGMTERSIETIVQQAEDRWRLLDTLIIHRVGLLRPADQIVLVLVASSHRPDAFAACECIMDFLKTEAVFWKKEHRSDGEVWIESTADDHYRRDGWRNPK